MRAPLGKRLVCAVALIVSIGIPALAQDSPDQLRAAALAALRQDDIATARTIADRLLYIDPGDSYAHLVQAVAALRQGDTTTAATAARRAFRNGDSKMQRHQSALIAADAAGKQQRGVALRYWLREAAHTAPDPLRRQSTLRILAQVTSASRWSGGLRLSFNPSSNVNGGSEIGYNIIDGLPWIGVLDGDAQALSGVVGTAQGRVSYRLHQSGTAVTLLSANLYLKRVALSAEAKAQSVSVTGQSLAYSKLDLQLDHRMQPAGMNGSLDLGIGIGVGHEGTGETATLLSASVARELALAPRLGLRLGMALDWETVTGRAGRDPIATSLHSEIRRKRANGDVIGFSLGLRSHAAAQASNDSYSVLARADYDIARRIGPVTLSGALGASFTDYADYRLGFLRPPGGRQDRSVFGEVSVGLPDVAWAGFSPALTLRAARTDSTVSRYDTQQLGVSFGIRSNF